MASELDDTVKSMRGLSIANDTLSLTKEDNHAFSRMTSEPMNDFEEVKRQVQQIRVGIGNLESFIDRDDSTPEALKEVANVLSDAARTVNRALEKPVTDYIVSLGDTSQDVQPLLQHFREKIKEQVRAILEATTYDDTVPRQALEECHKQAVDKRGILHSDNYYIPLEEAALESTYDPDFQSEEYYKDKNRLEIDKDYAKAERIRREYKAKQRNEDKRRTTQNWIKFWAHALAQCSGGSTLFLPLDHQRTECFRDVPRYLFRAFDPKSSGKSDATVVASSASIGNKPDRSKVDCLSKDRKESLKNLHGHLNKGPWFGSSDDNFMSWSSSLLFVLQYAIWRKYMSNVSTKSVKICVVDTTRFPCGQFVKDSWIIKTLNDESNQIPYVHNFIKLRERGYDNGEYLSQGTVYHRGRSCLVSLQGFIDAGLFDLYPEFDEPGGKEQWTKRVSELRSSWQTLSTTTLQEIRLAQYIAGTCFPKFRTSDLVVMLLMFKNRITKATLSEPQYLGWYNGYGPEEVQRHYGLVRSFNQQNEHGSFGPLSRLLELNLLEKFFDCTGSTA